MENPGAFLKNEMELSHIKNLKMTFEIEKNKLIIEKNTINSKIDILNKKINELNKDIKIHEENRRILKL